MANHGNGAGRLGRARTALMVLGMGVTALVAAAVRAESQGFLCPSSGRLVSVGLRADEVKRKCREPDDVQAYVELRTVRETHRRVVNGGVADVESRPPSRSPWKNGSTTSAPPGSRRRCASMMAGWSS